MTRLLLCALVALLLAPSAFAQATESDDLDLVVSIAPYAQILSLDNQDGNQNETLTFSFTPGLDESDPTSSAPPSAIDFDDEITFATNISFDHQVDISVAGATSDDWNEVSITVTPGSISTLATATSTSGDAGSCGSPNPTATTLTADDTQVAIASGISLCHATQLVNYSVSLDNIAAHADDRNFDVTYTIMQTSAPAP